MSTRAKVALTLWALALLAVPASASAGPVLDLQLQRTHAPTTHSDERLTYEIKVQNNGIQTPSVGEEVDCEASVSGTPSPTDVEVQWLRNGTPVGPMTTDSIYTLTPADAGKTLQCLVTGSNEAEDASGTATTTNGSKVLSNVTTAEGSGTLVAGSKQVSGLTTTSGSFRGSPLIGGVPVSHGQAITGPGIPDPATGTGDLSFARGHGDLTQGSNIVTNVTVEQGAYEVGQEEELPSNVYLEPGTTITAVGATTLTLSKPAVNTSGSPLPFASKTISDLETSSGAFAVGQTIIAPTNRTAFSPHTGFDSPTTITAVGPDSLQLSNFPTVPRDDFPLSAASTITAVGSGTLTMSAPATTSGTQPLSAGAQPFAPGQILSGPGIPPGTAVVDVNHRDVLLSAAATATASDVEVAGAYAPIRALEASPPLVVEPVPSPAPLSGTSGPSLGLEGAFFNPEVLSDVGEIALCKAPTDWTGDGIVWSFEWLRNGAPAPHPPLETTATTSRYELQESDVYPSASMQCKVTGEDAAGNRAVATSWMALSPQPPFPYTSVRGPSPRITTNNKTSGPVTVKAELPEGTQVLRGFGTPLGGGWTCAKTPQVVPRFLTCTREDVLHPGSFSPKLEVEAQVFPKGPETLTTKAIVSGGGAPDDSAEDTVSGLLPAVPFGFKAFETKVFDDAGVELAQAGGHPYEVHGNVEFNEHERAVEVSEVGGDGLRAAVDAVREVRTEVPPGFVGNPEVMSEKCQSITDVVAMPSTCPAGSVVGGVSVEISAGPFPDLPLYAMEPERGTPAQFAFAVTGVPPGFAYTLTPELRPEDGYAITLVAAPVQKHPELFEANVTLCGFGAKIGPSSNPNNQETKFKGCREAGAPGATGRPFMTLPTRCGDPASATTDIYADSWEEPGVFAHAQSTVSTPEGCDALTFEPSLKARPTTEAADSPTGLEVEIEIPQNEDPEGTATPHLDKSVITLPEGMTVNASSANGLGACSPQQIRLGTNEPVSCPDSSKIGAGTVTTPILDAPLPASLYIATPHANPFGSLLALYLVIDDPDAGILVKLPGRVEANPQSGQLSTTFDDNPEAPVEAIDLRLRSGASAPLQTPSACGKYTTTSQLTPHSAPESGPPAATKDTWTLKRGPGGGACQASLPNAPAFEAGTASPIAGAYTPFVFKLRREDGSQRFSQVTLNPPPGLLAKLAGVSSCPDSALAAAASKDGRAEQAAPSCPASSRVGSVVASAGAGPAPYNAQGEAYLTGPYKGAPLSLAVITPAVAGPFDLGTVVVRTAIHVDPTTAKISATSDPLPSILQGIPLNVRSIAISLDRPSFTRNPTSCDEMAIGGSVLSTLGQSAPLANRFQVGECARLNFAPKLSLRLRGGTKRGDYPALRATLTARPGEANIASTSVTLPPSAFVAQEHIRTVCTRVQFAADACPKGSIYGKATATTPLLDEPLTGPVYLRSSNNTLPDLVVALKGPDSRPVKVEVAGRTDSHKGALRNSFEVVPDAPVSKFTLELFGGSKGLVVNSRNLCLTVQRASVRMSAHNGMRRNSRPVVKNGCKKKSRRGSKGRGSAKPRR